LGNYVWWICAKYVLTDESALLYDDEELLASQDGVGIYDGCVHFLSSTWCAASCFCVHVINWQPAESSRRLSDRFCSRLYASPLSRSFAEPFIVFFYYGSTACDTDKLSRWLVQIFAEGLTLPRVLPVAWYQLQSTRQPLVSARNWQKSSRALTDAAFKTAADVGRGACAGKVVWSACRAWIKEWGVVWDRHWE
jgi:hypothetical protein